MKQTCCGADGRMSYVCVFGVGAVWYGWVQESGSWHRRLGEALEEVHWEWGTGEGEVSTGMEEQGRTAEAVYDASDETRPHDLRRTVSTRPVRLHAYNHTGCVVRP